MRGDPTQDAEDKDGRQLVYVWLADGTQRGSRKVRGCAHSLGQSEARPSGLTKE